MASLRISGVVPESIVDGKGIRYVIFTQGCPHHCPGCHNPQTHDFEGGYVVDTDGIPRPIRFQAGGRSILLNCTSACGKTRCSKG